MHRGNEAQSGLRQHPVVDDGLMHTHEGVAGCGCEILDTQSAQHIDYVIAAATRIGDRLIPRCDLLRALVRHGGPRLAGVSLGRLLAG